MSNKEMRIDETREEIDQNNPQRCSQNIIQLQSLFQNRRKALTMYGKTSPLISDMTSNRYEERKISHTINKADAALDGKVKMRDLMKSVIGYFLGSMFTFLPGMRDLIGTASHMTAISVLFMSPSQTIGSFLQSLVFGLFFILYGLLIGLLSLLSIRWFHLMGFLFIGKCVILLLFIGASTFFLSLVKAKSSNPAINRCIPQAFIVKFLVIINYVPFVDTTFSIQKVVDLGKALGVGLILNLLVCLIIFPRLESKSLKKDVEITLNSFSLVLDMLTKAFLLESNCHNKELNKTLIKKLMNKHRKQQLGLEKRLRLAKLEFLGRLGTWKLVGKVVDRITRLTMKLSSLSNSVDAQLDILDNLDEFNAKTVSSCTLSNPRYNNRNVMYSEGSDDNYDAQVLLDFVKLVSPSLKDLSNKCIHVLEELEHVLSDNRKIDYTNMRIDVNLACKIFKMEQSNAFNKLYTKTSYDGKPNEEIFLVYFFVFSMQEFSTELTLLINAVELLHHSDYFRIVEVNKLNWIRDFFWEAYALLRWNILNLTRKDELSKPTSINSIQNNYIPQTIYQKMSLNTWKFFVNFDKFNYKFALKSSVSVMILAIPAFMDDYKHLFKMWKGAWILISFMIVMYPTIGASNVLALYRTGGTVFGAIFGYIIYSVFPKNAFVLTLVSTIFSIPCLYYYLYGKRPRIGQFTLITYNLIVLTKFSYHKKVFDHLWKFALARAFSVSLGVALGVFITTWIAPYEARSELRKGIAVFLLRTSELYNKLVSLYNEPNVTNSLKGSPHLFSASLVDATTNLIIDQNENPRYKMKFKEYIRIEMMLQMGLMKLQELVPLARSEPRLKGPFPYLTYGLIIDSCQVILDKFVSIRIVITKDQWINEIRENYVKPLENFRPALVGNIMLYFFVLASSLELKSPLPPYMPPASNARLEMIKALRELSVVKNRLLLDVHNDTHVFYYAFIVLLDDIIAELKRLYNHLITLFGSQLDLSNLFISRI